MDNNFDEGKVRVSTANTLIEAMSADQLSALGDAVDSNKLAEILAAKLDLPIVPYNVAGKSVLLLVIDAIPGFTLEGALADPTSMQPMVTAISDTVRDLKNSRPQEQLKVLFPCDAHEDWQVVTIPGAGPEGTDLRLIEGYLAHCEAGTPESEVDPGLQWILQNPNITAMRMPKLAISSIIGTMKRAATVRRPSGTTYTWELPIVDIIATMKPDVIIGVGDCTDICDQVMREIANLVHSARFGSVAEQGEYTPDVVLYTPACATYDLVIPEVVNHPGSLYHLMGQAILAQNGVILASELVYDDEAEVQVDAVEEETDETEAELAPTSVG